MAPRMTRRRWLTAAGAATLLLAGGLLAGPVAGLAQGGPETTLSEDDAVDIATAQFPGTTGEVVELEEEDGRAVYEVALSNGYEVEVDGNSSDVLEMEHDDDDGEDDDGDDD